MKFVQLNVLYGGMLLLQVIDLTMVIKTTLCTHVNSAEPLLFRKPLVIASKLLPLRLEGLVGVPEHVSCLPVNPPGGPCSPVTGGRELPPVAALAVDVSVGAVVDGVEVELLGAGGAAGTLLVIALSVGVNLLSLENGASAPNDRGDTCGD